MFDSDDVVAIAFLEMRLIYSSRKLYPDLEQRCPPPWESFVDFYDEVNGEFGECCEDWDVTMQY